MREDLKKLFPELQKILQTDFIDGDIYFKNYTEQKLVTLNYTQFTDDNIKTLIRVLAHKRLLDEQKKLCNEIIKLAGELKIESDVYIVLQKNGDCTCLLHLCKKPNSVMIPLTVFITVDKKEYGILWRKIGRPVWKRMGWQIL
jgi:predicted metal-binding protein